MKYVASSPDSSLIATASGDGTSKVFDAETGDILHTFLTKHGQVDSIRFSNESRPNYVPDGLSGVCDPKSCKKCRRIDIQTRGIALWNII
jgi:WD40 repeat protein